MRPSRLLAHKTCPDVPYLLPPRVLCCRQLPRGGRGKIGFGPGVGSKLRDRGVSHPTITRCFWKKKYTLLWSVTEILFYFSSFLARSLPRQTSHAGWLNSRESNDATREQVRIFYFVLSGPEIAIRNSRLPEKSRNPSSAAKRFTLVANRQPAFL